MVIILDNSLPNLFLLQETAPTSGANAIGGAHDLLASHHSHTPNGIRNEPARVLFRRGRRYVLRQRQRGLWTSLLGKWRCVP